MHTGCAGPRVPTLGLQEPRVRPAAEPTSRQEGAPRRRRVEGRGSRSHLRIRSRDPGVETRAAGRLPYSSQCGSGTTAWRHSGHRYRRPGTGLPGWSAPARKRGSRGGGAGKRFRGRGARAGAAAGAAGTGLAPAAAEGAPRAGDVSTALWAGETRRPGAAGSG
jgi:hypothetical protein